MRQKLLARAVAQLACRNTAQLFPLCAARGFASRQDAPDLKSSCSDPGAHLQQSYAAMLQSGQLKSDFHQQQLMQQLAALLQQLQAYSSSVAAYRTNKDAYAAEFQQRLAELKALDDQQEQQQQQPQPPAQQQGWLQRVLSSAGLSQNPKPKTLTPQQKARAAAAARRARVLAELGPAPEPPAAPQGLYIYGSVGSGKSLLMDMFYDSARQTLDLDHSRRLHFNAAMLEMHSRLHHLDLKRQRQQQQRRHDKDAAATSAVYASSSRSSSGGGVVGSSLAGLVNSDTPPPEPEAGFSLVHDSVEEVGGEEGCCDDAASDAQVSAWFDEGILRQKEAKAAVLAIRRHLREARAGRVPEARLAAANAAVMSAAARSFIRARGPDPTDGWTGSSSSSSSSGSSSGKGSDDRLAALLCFDEMQVGDVFSAASLKAMLEALTAEGCVVVTTSNRHPADLPRHGLHEAMFSHFLNTLFTSCRLFELSAGTDYRRLSLGGPASLLLQQPLLPTAGSSSDGVSTDATAATGAAGTAAAASAVQQQQRLYYWPLNPVTQAALNQKWAQALGAASSSSSGSSSSSSSRLHASIPSHPLTHAALGAASSSNGSSSSSSFSSVILHSNTASSSVAAATTAASASAAVLPVLFGRQLCVSRSAPGVAWFDFTELCGGPLGAADYMAVAQAYHTVFISGIPAMSMNIRDQARRFITLIDELYNARCLLVCSAALPPDQLFAGAEGDEPILDLEGLQFEGAVEGSKLRTDLMADGSVAPVASTATAAAEATTLLGGMEEKFAFSRAVSRLYEMQSPLYAAARSRS